MSNRIAGFLVKSQQYYLKSLGYYDGEIKAFSFSDEKEEALFILERIQQLLQFGHKDIENNLEYNNFAFLCSQYCN